MGLRYFYKSSSFCPQLFIIGFKGFFTKFPLKFSLNKKLLRLMKYLPKKKRNCSKVTFETKAIKAKVI